MLTKLHEKESKSMKVKRERENKTGENVSQDKFKEKRRKTCKV